MEDQRERRGYMHVIKMRHKVVWGVGGWSNPESNRHF